MKINQVYEFVNDIYAQATGKNGVTTADAAGLVSIGKDVLSSEANTENFFGTLVDRIAKSKISNRPYNARVKSLLMDTFQFGAVLQKIYVAPTEAKESAHWDVTDGEKSQIYIVKPTVSQKLFSGLTTWELDTAIPDTQARSAFTSAEEMAALISAIDTALNNSMNIDLEAMASTVYATMIANRIIYEKDPDSVRVGTNSNKKQVVVDLRKGYNTYYGLASGDTGYLATAADCKRTPEFYRYASLTIKKFKNWMNSMSTLYNVPTVTSDGKEFDYYRFTDDTNLNLTIVEDFAADFQAHLQSEVFHNEFTALPNYTEVPYWQGSGIANEDTRKISITVESAYNENGDVKKYTVTQDGVVAILADVDSMGMTLDNQRIRSVYDNRHEVTAQYAKADKGYFVDPTENCVVFLVCDEIATPVAAD